MANTKKQQIVQEVIDLLNSSNTNFTLLQYDKTSHKALEDLRIELRKSDTKVKIIKNTLFRKALKLMAEKDNSLSDFLALEDLLKEPSALLTFGEDWATGIKSFSEFAKKDESLSFKVGYIDGTAYKKDGLDAIAKLPGKDQLIAKLIGTMKNPISKTVSSLKNNQQKLVFVLSERGKQTE